MEVPGRCHLCGQTKPVRYCRTCEHWFCDDCRVRYWHRGLAAVKQMIGRRNYDCCGPTQEKVTHGVL